jgi:hypothetical protein
VILYNYGKRGSYNFLSKYNVEYERHFQISTCSFSLTKRKGNVFDQYHNLYYRLNNKSRKSTPMVLHFFSFLICLIWFVFIFHYWYLNILCVEIFIHACLNSELTSKISFFFLMIRKVYKSWFQNTSRRID